MTALEKPRQSDQIRKAKSLKRAGSPALSESSGNEASRKKIKTTSVTASDSRPGISASQSVRHRSAAGRSSASEGEATAGEKPDNANAQRNMAKFVGSRANSATSPTPLTPGKYS